MNIYNSFKIQADRNADKIALYREDEKNLLYRDLEKYSEKVARWVDSNVSDNGKVCIYMQDTPEYVAAVLGIYKSGRVAVPVNTLLSKQEKIKILSETSCEAMFTSNVLETTAKHYSESVESLSNIFKISTKEGFNEKLEEFDRLSETGKVMDEETSTVLYTSGTTGMPKGVALSHRNILSMIESGKLYSRLNEEDTTLISVPLFHAAGLNIGCLSSICSGSSIVLQEFWNAEEWMKLVEKYDVNVGGFILTMINDVLSTYKENDNLEYNFDSLDFCTYGGGKVPTNIVEEFEKEFNCKMVNVYGLTESSGNSITFSRYDVEKDNIKKGSIGYTMPCLEAKIETEGYKDVPNRERGELLLRGDSIMKGYVNRPEINDEVFDGEWFRTGDLVEKDKEDYYYYIDRKDDMIITGGENVSPSYVEGILSEFDGVDEVAVFDTPHDRYGEAVTAAIVPNHDKISEDKIEKLVENSEKLASYKKPKRVFLIDRLPKTDNMKVDKSELREKFGED